MTHATRRAVIVQAAGVAGLVGLGSATAAVPVKARWPGAPGDMNLGNPNARVHVVEYLSLTCPHCAHFHETVFPAFKAKYIDKGRVYFTLRELLTAPAQVAAAGFMMARCNGGTRYFPIIGEVFRSQSRWQGGDIKDILLEIAKANGQTEAQFEACLVDEKALDALQARIDYATGTDGVNGTPTFFINGKMVANDHVPTLAELDLLIAKALVPPRAKPPNAVKPQGGR